MFDKSENVKATGPKGIWLQLKIGASDAVAAYAVIDKAGGSQPFRTQYDMAADGTQYILTAGHGIGDYSFKIFEGPFSACAGATKPPSFAKNHGKLDTYASRKLTVVMPLSTAGTENAISTSDCAVFSGLINGADTQTTRGENGEIQIITEISAQGVWSSK